MPRPQDGAGHARGCVDARPGRGTIDGALPSRARPSPRLALAALLVAACGRQGGPLSTNGVASSVSSTAAPPNATAIDPGAAPAPRPTAQNGPEQPAPLEDADWRALHPPDGAFTLRDIAVGPDGQLTGVGERGVIVQSTDGGATWTRRRSGTNGVLRAVAHAGPQTLIAAGKHGILRSTDGGVTWTTVAAARPDQDTVSREEDMAGHHAVWARGPDDVYVAGTGSSLLRSTDGGATWSRSFVDPRDSADDLGIGRDTWRRDDRRNFYSVTGGARGEVWAAGAPGLYRSRGDNVWESVATGFSGGWYTLRGVWDGGPDDLRVIVADLSDWSKVTPGNPYPLRSGRGLVLRSKDRGAHWTREPSCDARALGPIAWIRGDREHLIAGGEHGTLLRLRRSAGCWEQMAAPNVDVHAIALVSPDRWLVSAGEQRLVSTDRGRRWTSSASFSDRLQAIWSPDGRDVVVAGTDGAACTVARSTDGGATWKRRTLACSVIHALAGSGQEVHAFADAGRHFRSTDGGATWRAIDTGAREDLRGAWMSGADIVACTDRRTCSRSSDHGETWATVQLESNGTGESVAGSRRDDVYVACGYGICRSTDGGAGWTRLPSTTTRPTISVLAAPDGTVLAGVGVGQGANAILRSRDHGATWEALRATSEVNGPIVGDGPDLLAIADSSDEKSRGAVGMSLGGRVLRSPDGGDTWTVSETGALALRAIWAGNGVALVAGGNGAVLRRALR